MALVPGTRLGPYEIVAPLGAGGMGEVYRARDTRLGRDVAIKILPKEMSADPVRKQRFEREAKTISGLNHPNICTLYDVGSQDGVDYLVLECVEGETLAKRLEKGPLPPEQVLKYGAQIADALDKAHRAGIVHRDLKPGNVILTSIGAKLLDFGLAKPTVAVANLVTLTAMSPTQPPVTQEGMVVGTFQYMSPEQVEGKELDGRSDIFSLGAVLYEMLTGQRAFEGKSQLSVASAILERDPQPISTVKPLTPESLEHTIRRCLAKDREVRWQSARDLAEELKWTAGSGATGVRAGGAEKSTRRESWGWIAAALVAVTLVLGGIWVLRGRTKTEVRQMALEILPPQGGRVYRLAISPDGKQLAMAVQVGQTPQLWIRDMKTYGFRQLPGAEEARFMFWSADSQSLAIFARGKLIRVNVSNGNVQLISEASWGFGGDWNAAGDIVFNSYFNEGLLRVSASGGTARPLTALDKARHETIHAYPHFLQDGKHFVFLNRGGPGDANHMCMASLDGGEIVELAEADAVVGYTAPGYLLWVIRGALKAQRFDNNTLGLQGEPSVVVNHVGYEAENGYALASVSKDGTLVYAKEAYEQTEFVVLDKVGHMIRQFGEPAWYGGFRASPDGTKIAVDVKDPETGASDLWIGEVSRGTFTRLTNTPWNEEQPVWSADGSKVYYASDKNGMYDLFEREVNGVGAEQELFRSEADKTPSSASPDGENLLYMTWEGTKGPVLWKLGLTGDKRPLKVGEGQRSDLVVSPKGHLAAYYSDESGRNEVYLTTFPESRGRTMVSGNGGVSPRWRSDGKELYYITGDGKVMAVDVKPEGEEEVGKPKALFAIPATGNTTPWLATGIFDVLSDGKNFVFHRKLVGQEPQTVHVLLNWDAELRSK